MATRTSTFNNDMSINENSRPRHSKSVTILEIRERAQYFRCNQPLFNVVGLLKTKAIAMEEARSKIFTHIKSERSKT